MTLPVLQYGHPVLRKKGVRLVAPTPEIERLIADMLETMKDAQGVGLAAQQVGHALQLAVFDVTPITDRPSTLILDGKEVEVRAHMPMVLINPEINPLSECVSGPEGCLSFPGIYSEVNRPDVIEVRALDRNWQPVQFRCGGLLSRAIQHECDHLNGILFIDRMAREDKEAHRPDLEAMQEESREALKKGLTPKVPHRARKD